MPNITQDLTGFTGDWECQTCCEQYDSPEVKPWIVEDDWTTICPNCIVGRFEQALENDYSWPARWGAEELNVRDFAGILHCDLLAAALDKEDEYAARVDDGVSVEALEGQVRGSDYQLCPQCSKVIALEDGCNHIVCLCMQNFCFICGQEAFDGSNHWVPGGCPRYGKVGSRRVVYDHDPGEPDHRSPWLLNSLAGNRPDTFQNVVENASEFAIGSWAWNTAMQASRMDDSLQDAMQRLLRADEWDMSFADRDHIERALHDHRWSSQLTEEEWALVVGQNLNQIRMFLNEGPSPPDSEPHPMVRHGLLTQPVGGVFNMTLLLGRMEAFRWMYQTVRDYSNEWIDHRQHHAVFHMGPGWPIARRIEAARLMLVLTNEGIEVTQGRFTFTKMRDSAILVTVNPPQPTGSANWRHEAYWRLDLLLNVWTQMMYLDDDTEAGLDDFERVKHSMIRSTFAAWEEQTGNVITLPDMSDMI